jgi:hypothetical protein
MSETQQVTTAEADFHKSRRKHASRKAAKAQNVRQGLQ